MRSHSPLALVLLSAISACSNPGATAHSFDRPSTIPAWAGDLTEAPEELVIYALDPMRVSAQELDAETPVFHGYRILGSTTLSQEADRRALVDLVWKGIAADDGTRAACFNPRHGIRAMGGERRADWVICFECLSLHVFDENGQQVNLGTKQFVEPRISSIYSAAGLELDRK